MLKMYRRIGCQGWKQHVMSKQTAASKIASQAHVQGFLRELAESSQFRLNNRTLRQTLWYLQSSGMRPRCPCPATLPCGQFAHNVSKLSVEATQSYDALTPDKTQCSGLTWTCEQLRPKGKLMVACIVTANSCKTPVQDDAYCSEGGDLWYFTRQLLLLLAASSFQLSSATCPLAAKILVIRPPCITTEACWPSSRVICFMLAVGGKSVMTGWRVEVILLINVEYDTVMSDLFGVLRFAFGSSCPAATSSGAFPRLYHHLPFQTVISAVKHTTGRSEQSATVAVQPQVACCVHVLC